MPFRFASRLACVAIDRARPARRQIAVLEVGGDRRRVALFGITKTRPVAGRNADDVAAVDDHAGGDSVALALPRGPDHLDIVGCAVGAAFEPPGRNPRARIAEGEEGPVAAHAIVDADPFAAAPAAFAALFRVERRLVDVEAVARLGDLGGAIEGAAVEPGEDRAVAVA